MYGSTGVNNVNVWFSVPVQCALQLVTFPDNIIIIIIIGSYLAHFHTVQCALSSYISPYASLKSSVLMDDLNSNKVFE